MSRTAESPFSPSIKSSHSLRSMDSTFGNNSMQDFPQIADQRHINLDVLVDLRRIDLDVNLLGIGRVSFQGCR